MQYRRSRWTMQFAPVISSMQSTETIFVRIFVFSKNTENAEIVKNQSLTVQKIVRRAEYDAKGKLAVSFTVTFEQNCY